MATLPPSVLDSEDVIYLDTSTAPTTPEGSFSFSPVLRPRNGDTIDLEARMLSGVSLSSAIEASTPAPAVRNICCVGAGYVGGPTAAVVAFQNPHIRVNVVDKDERRIRRWNSQHLPIYEPGLNEIVRTARDGSREFTFLNEAAQLDSLEVESDASTSSSECDSQCDHHQQRLTTVSAREPNLFFSNDVTTCIAAADIVLIAVNTPTKCRGAGAGAATDMTAFEAVTAIVAQHARPGAIIVEKSTVPCRTAQFIRETLAIHRPGLRFEVLSNPEFLAAGTAIKDLLTADRVLIGSSPTPHGRRAAAALAAVYAAWIPPHRIITTNVFSSELAKLVANSMLAQRVSSINSIAAICEATGADVDEVALAIGADMRIGPKFLRAGIGFGGSCFKKDILSLVYLAESLNLPEVADYWRAVVTMNEYSRNRFAARIVHKLNNTLRGKKLAVLGYAFKKDTNDTRESPALEIIRSLLEEGPREIAVFDPCCLPAATRDEITRLIPGAAAAESVSVYEDAYSACAAADAIIIATEFDEFGSQKGPSTSSNRGKATAKDTYIDPRPFSRLEPSESDILALQQYLVRSAPPTQQRLDPLGRFRAAPGCADDCLDCALEHNNDVTVAGSTDERRSKAWLDWAKISYHMRRPKWLFDGRGVVRIGEMEALGFRVETVGRHMGAR